MDLSKRDMALTYEGRIFSVRAYRDDDSDDGPGWRAVIVEARTPVSYEQFPKANPGDCFAEAIRFLVAMVDVQLGVAAMRA